MNPFFFGSADHSLFGIFQPAQGETPGRAGVLLCNPYGQEAIRVHRIYRVLADRLVRAGAHVLRFDYYATGDSAGEDAQGDLDDWAGDVIAAHEALVRRSRASRVVWIGARLGATLAIEASATCKPDLLVLWEPILDGVAYLHDLAEATREALETSYDVPVPAWRAMLASGRIVPERECNGIELGERLRLQLEALTPARIATPKAGRCDLIVRADAPTSAALAERWTQCGLHVERLVLKHDFDWMPAEALSPGLVPADIVRFLVHRAER